MKAKKKKKWTVATFREKFSSTSVRVADENDLNKMRQMVLTAKKIKLDADKMKELHLH